MATHLKPGVDIKKIETLCSLQEQDKLDLDNCLNSIRKIIIFHLDNFFIHKGVFGFVVLFWFLFFLAGVLFFLVRHPPGNIARLIFLYTDTENKNGEILVERTN